VFGLGGDDVIFLFLVETADTLDCHVVRFRRTRSEYDILGIGADEVRNVLRKRIKHANLIDVFGCRT